MNKMIISSSPKRHNTVRLHKDEPYLYTEDGLLHSNNEQFNREPLPLLLNTIEVTNNDTLESNKDVKNIDDFNNSFEID